MEPTARSVLVIGSQEALSPVLDRLLRAASFYPEVVEGREALELLRSLPFDVVVVVAAELGIELRELVRGLRSPDSASHRTSVLVLAASGPAAAASELLGVGVNRVVPADIGPAALAAAIKELATTSPRVPLRALIRLGVRRGGRESQALCQTENLSASGVLVRTELVPETGTQMRFELVVPGATEPIRGTAEVVRLATGHRERAAGIGLRFIAFDADGARRLAAFVASRAS